MQSRKYDISLEEMVQNTKEQLNGNLRAVRQAEEGLFYTLLDNTSSLLEEIRKSGGKWLASHRDAIFGYRHAGYIQSVRNVVDSTHLQKGVPHMNNAIRYNAETAETFKHFGSSQDWIGQ